MDVIVISNGLGNQMSQYALYLRKKNINSSTRYVFDEMSSFEHNAYELERVFGIKNPDKRTDKFLGFLFRILGIRKYAFVTKPILFIINSLKLRIIREVANYDFDPGNLQTKNGINFFYGGWHSEKYFIPIKQQVYDTFSFKISDNESKIFNEILNKIKNTNSVSIHIRRGDFLNERHFDTFGAVCTLNYFLEAVKKIETLEENPNFFVFSNDPNWVRDHLKIDNLTVVDLHRGKDSWKDMYLMSQCKHHINSNSSFSWWAAWLNPYSDKKVIVPKFFINNLETKDIYPEDWLVLEDY